MCRKCWNKPREGKKRGNIYTTFRLYQSVIHLSPPEVFSFLPPSLLLRKLNTIGKWFHFLLTELSDYMNSNVKSDSDSTSLSAHSLNKRKVFSSVLQKTNTRTASRYYKVMVYSKFWYSFLPGTSPLFLNVKNATWLSTLLFYATSVIYRTLQLKYFYYFLTETRQHVIIELSTKYFTWFFQRRASKYISILSV